MMFDGLYSYERVLMVLGIILFLVLTFGLVVFIVQKRKLAALFAFYIFPVLMIGFPAFQKVSYDDGMLSLEKETHSLQAEPNNPATRTALLASIDKVQARARSDANASLAVARAYSSLDQPDKALEHVDAALQVSPNLDEAVRLRAKFTRDALSRPRLTTRPHDLAVADANG
jgi:hypothetical protein